MPYGTDVIMIYDGSFEGLMSCIFDIYSKKLTPIDIVTEENYTPSLYESYTVETDYGHSDRVREGIRVKASLDALTNIEYCFLSCREGKELLIANYARLALKEGRRAVYMLANDTVIELNRAVKGLTGEAHQYKGFVRFTDCGEALVSVIEPKNFVLPLIADHFCDRFPNEAFMIFDKTHNAALIYKEGLCRIVALKELPFVLSVSEETDYQSLWKGYTEAIAIKERANPRCQMGHMQKRYWKHLTEMRDTPEIAVPNNRITG